MTGEDEQISGLLCLRMLSLLPRDLFRQLVWSPECKGTQGKEGSSLEQSHRPVGPARHPKSESRLALKGPQNNARGK